MLGLRTWPSSGPRVRERVIDLAFLRAAFRNSAEPPPHIQKPRSYGYGALVRIAEDQGAEVEEARKYAPPSTYATAGQVWDGLVAIGLVPKGDRWMSREPQEEDVAALLLVLEDRIVRG